MYLLDFYQGGNVIHVGVFQTMNEGREFVRQIPGYEQVEEEGFNYEYLKPEALPEYLEISFSGNVFPMTKYMFSDDSKVSIEWIAVSNFSKEGSGIVEGATRVDAYSVNNEEVKEYINKREKQYKRAKEILEAKGMEADRNFFGSEDGEAILYRKKDSQEWHFLFHMDPLFVEEKDLEATIEDMLMDVE